MNILTMALSGGGLLSALVLAILYGLERAKRVKAEAGVAAAALAKLQADKELVAFKTDRTDFARKAHELDDLRLAQIRKLEDIIALHPEMAADSLRALGRPRVLPDQGGHGPGTPASVSGKPASAPGGVGTPGGR